MLSNTAQGRIFIVFWLLGGKKKPSKTLKNVLQISIKGIILLPSAQRLF